MIRIHASGPHIRRCPLSYPALAPLFEGRLRLVESADAADMAVFAHPLDLMSAPRALIEAWRRRRFPIVLLSEEPFWDSLHSPDPLAREVILETSYGAVPVIQINHQTSTVFAFARIPYYLLTDPRFARAYARIFARNAAVGAAEWQARFAARPMHLSFMFERRPEAFHDVAWPEAGLVGLCAWRTRLAIACTPERVGGPVERLGRSWEGGAARQTLDDWHGDKLALLDGRARMIGAFENTHQPDYVTEKIFDAFACGAVPLYRAGPGHRMHRLGLPQGAWINLDIDDAEAAAARLGAERFGREVAEAYVAAQAQLLALFRADGIWQAERARLGDAVVAALDRAAG